MLANNITEVINILEQIIMDSKNNESPLGYFAALYLRVTIEVKNKLGTAYFDDDARMEKLDVIFANRYLKAYFDYQKDLEITHSWKKTFDKSTSGKLIVLQHLLLGMNAHINLDLGIAAAEISQDGSIDSLQNDFNRINEILASLVNEVQEDLSRVWPILQWILQKLKGADDFIVDFSMKIARDGAWKFAKTMSTTSNEQRANVIKLRDQRIAKIADLITDQSFLVRFLFWIIRITEVGSVSEKIASLEIKG